MTSVPSAIDRTATYLRDCLAKGEWALGHRLPSLDALAQKADVSRTTMWKALGILKREKRLTVKRGGHIIAGSPEETAAIRRQPAASQLWQKKRVLLEQDILNGQYPRGELLPSSSELQARYGVCFTTLKKILNLLVTDKVLVPFKKSYLVPQLRSRRFQSTIVLLLEGLSAIEFDVENERIRAIINTLEDECQRSGLHLLPVGYDPADPDAVAKIRPHLQDDENVVGYLIDIWWVTIREIEQRFLDIIHELSVHKKPVAILDETTNMSLPLPISADKNVRVFRMAGSSAGADAARFLLNLGHRHMAYLSYQHAQPWSKSRLEGANSQFENAGLKGNIVPFVKDEILGSWQLILALFDESPDAFANIFNRTLSREEIKDLVDNYRIVREKHLLSGITFQGIEHLRDALKLLPELNERIADLDVWRAVLDYMWESVIKRVHEPYLEPLFDQVLAQPRLTAWMASDDATAIAALKFLKRKGIRVPQDISVFGFDNKFPAFEYRLTSYDFNLRGIVRRMLQFIFSPAKFVHQSRSQTVEVDGVIMVRESTGKPSKIR